MATDFYNSSQSVVSIATAIAEVILLIRLAWLGLLWEFKIFSIFVAFDAAFTVTLMGWDYHVYSYEQMWSVATPIWTVLLAGSTLELLRGLGEPFTGESTTRTVGLYGFLSGMTISAGALMMTHPQAILRSTVLLTDMARTCILCGCIFGILTQGFCFWIGDAPLVANWRRHRRILLPYITAFLMASFTVHSKNRQFAEWISLLSNLALLGCFSAWILAVRRLFRDVWYGTAPWGTPCDDVFAENLVYHMRENATKEKERRRRLSIRAGDC